MSGQLEDLPVETSQSEPLFTTVNMLDPQLCVKSSINYAVSKSAQNITYHSQMASSATSSGLNFSVIVPSLSTVISRKVMLRSQLVFTLTGTAAAGERLINWGVDTSLAPFAIHQCIQNMNVLINSSSFTFDCRNNLDLVLRTMDKEVLEEYANTTPIFFDNYASYTDAVGAANSPFSASFDSSAGYRGRGSYPVTIANNGVNATGGALAKTVTITVNLCEPLVMSPFLMSTQSGANSQGFFGIQSLDCTINFITQSLARAIRSSVAGLAVTFQPTQGSTYLDFVYMTPHASQKLPARNVVPYLQLQNTVVNVPSIAQGTAQTVTSNTYQLNMIPDSVLICARKKAGTQTYNDADAYLPLFDPTNPVGSAGLSINFANTPGILAGNTPQSLWEYSNNAGTKQDWISFSGLTMKSVNVAGGGTTSAVAVSTTGPILNLQFGSAINLVSDWNAPSSIGNFSFQANVAVYNNTAGAINAGDYELICVFVNSGIVVSSLGSTSVYQGLLTKQDVLDATTKPTVNQGEYKRMYGAGWWNGLKSAVSTAVAAAPVLAKAAPHLMSAYKAATGSGRAAGMQAHGRSGSGSDKLKDRFY